MKVTLQFNRQLHAGFIKIPRPVKIFKIVLRLENRSYFPRTTLSVLFSLFTKAENVFIQFSSPPDALEAYTFCGPNNLALQASKTAVVQTFNQSKILGKRRCQSFLSRVRFRPECLVSSLHLAFVAPRSSPSSRLVPLKTLCAVLFVILCLISLLSAHVGSLTHTSCFIPLPVQYVMPKFDKSYLQYVKNVVNNQNVLLVKKLPFEQRQVRKTWSQTFQSLLKHIKYVYKCIRNQFLAMQSYHEY